MATFAEISNIHQDHSSSYPEKEERLRNLIKKSDVIENDLIDIYLQEYATSKNLHSESLEALEHYSKLFVDILRYAKLADLLSAVAANSDKKAATAIASMVRISWKLNSIEAINVVNIDGVVRFSLHFLSVDDLSLSQYCQNLLELTVPLNYPKYIPLLLESSQSHESDSTQYLRFLGLAALLSGKDEDAALACATAGAFDRIFQCCQSDDILLQINAIELFMDLAKTAYGLYELCNRGMVDWLIATSCGTATAPPNPLLVSVALHIIGEIFQKASHHSFQFVEKIRSNSIEQFLNTIENFLDDYDESAKINGLAVVAKFASISYHSLLLVYQHHRGNLINLWFALLNSSKSELSSAALNALVFVLDQSEDNYINNEKQVFVSSVTHPEPIDAAKIVEIKKALVHKIGETKQVATTVQYLLKCAKQPIGGLREAAMHVLRSILAQQPTWGFELLFGGGNYHTNEFWLYVKDRTTEFHDKRGKEFKFAIIEAIAQSPHRQLLSEDVNKTIDMMIRQGPFYMPPRVAEMETM